MKRIHLISGPRNVSTALMYSFGNRTDCTVVDEAFYAHYLSSHPEIEHPGKDEILESMSSSAEQVIEDVIFGSYPTPLVFFKNMAHHFDGVDWGFMNSLSNVFLIRRPDELLSSFIKNIPHPTMLDIGLKLEYYILEYLRLSKAEFMVIDSGALLEDPKRYLETMCDRLNIPYSDTMLEWSPGPRSEDGVWAKYWYGNVHKSNGFAKPEKKEIQIPERLNNLLDEAWYYYEEIGKYSLKI